MSVSQGLEEFQELKSRRLVVPFLVVADDFKKRFHSSFLLPVGKLGCSQVETRLMVVWILHGQRLEAGKVAGRLYPLFRQFKRCARRGYDGCGGYLFFQRI
jgi:hypothetical protein